MKTAYDILRELMAHKKSVISVWEGMPFEKIKLMSTTEKGDIAEDFLAQLLQIHGYVDVEVKKGRRGHYDVVLNNSVFFEVKAATQDTNGNFQFNGIRYDRDYTHLFCLGITPDKLYYLIVNKIDLMKKKYRMVSMAKGSNATFKLSRRIAQMGEFENFEAGVETAINET